MADNINHIQSEMESIGRRVHGMENIAGSNIFREAIENIEILNQRIEKLEHINQTAIKAHEKLENMNSRIELMENQKAIKENETKATLNEIVGNMKAKMEYANLRVINLWNKVDLMNIMSSKIILLIWVLTIGCGLFLYEGHITYAKESFNATINQIINDFEIKLRANTEYSGTLIAKQKEETEILAAKFEHANTEHITLNKRQKEELEILTAVIHAQEVTLYFEIAIKDYMLDAKIEEIVKTKILPNEYEFGQ